MRIVAGLVAIMIAGTGLTGCGEPNEAERIGKVVGQASYRERIAVPPGTRLEVTVANVTAAPPPGQMLTRIVVAKAGQPPYEFEVPFRRDDIVDEHRYVVTARLMDREQVLFETRSPAPVITRGHPTEVELVLQQPNAESPPTLSVPDPLTDLPATFTGTLPCADCPGIDYHIDFFGDETFHMRTEYRERDEAVFYAIGRWARLSDRDAVVLRGAGDEPVRFALTGAGALRLLDQTGEAIDSELDYTLERADSFDPIAPELRMRGMYSYMADAGRFTECRTGRTMPVAMEDANASLERGYLEARSEPGEELLAEITGRIARRAPMEGDGTVPTVIPLAFHGVRPGETCGTPFTDAEPIGTYWKLTRLGDTAILPIAEAREPHIVLGAEGRLSGSDGCNRLMGGYEIDGRRLDITEIASTMMACPQGMEQADQFRAALERVATFRIAGSHLELYDADGELLARFEAIYDK